MMSRGHRYTIVGFSAELDWRPLLFVKPLPQNRVCGACGIVRPKTVLLPCGHTLCWLCYGQCAQEEIYICPLDGCEFQEEDVDWRTFLVEELLRREVLCWNEGAGCRYATAAAGVSVHFRSECEHHYVCCQKCSGAVLFSRMVAHIKSSICKQMTPFASNAYGTPGQNAEADIFTSFGSAFRQQVDEVKEFLIRIASDARTHGDRLNEVSHRLNSLNESLKQERAEGTINESSMPNEQEITEHDEGTNDFRTTEIQMLNKIFATLTGFEKTLKDGLDNVTSQNRHNISEIATVINGFKDEADEKCHKAVEDIKTILLHVKINVSHCTIFVKNVRALQETATKKGISLYENQQVYLRGYCMVLGVVFKKVNDSVIVCAALRLQKGDMDDAVQWPFEHTVKLTVIHPKHGSILVSETKPSRSSKYYQRPVEASNDGVALVNSGLDFQELKGKGYVEDDQLRVVYELLL